jgi:hypothetical protein
MLEVISKPISGNHPESARCVQVSKASPPFSKGGQGGLDKPLIIPLNPPLGKGDLKTSFSILAWLRNVFEPEVGFETGSNHA